MAKVRVYELAKELGVDARQVMAVLATAGEFVRSASSTVEPAMVPIVREKLRRQPGAEKTDAPERHLAPSPISTRTTARWLTPQAGRPMRPRPTVALRDLAPLERVIAEYRSHGNRIPKHDIEAIRAEARAWANEWFTDKEAAQWLTLRMTPANARRCRDFGITPKLICLPFQMPGRALARGTLTYLTAFFRNLVTIAEIRDELVRVGHLPQSS